MGVPPARCFAFEDAVNGVQAALDAGMRVAAVRTTTPEAALRGAGAEFVLADFAQLPAGLEQALFG